MTIPLKEQYAELLALAQQYLLQEHSRGDSLIADPQTYVFLKQTANKPKTTSQTAQTPNIPFKNPVAAPKIASQQVIKESLPPKTSPKFAPHASIQKNEEVPLPSEKISKEKTPNLSTVGISKSFALEPLPAAPIEDFNDLRKLILERFPAQMILDQIPSDEEARQTFSFSKHIQPETEVIILFNEESPSQNAFLANLNKAIHKLLAPSILLFAGPLEIQSAWEEILNKKELKLIIASEALVQSLQKLKQHYTKNGSQHFLGNIPSMVLADYTRYFKEPQLKQELWNQLSLLLKNSQR
jgi:hypothetical protein